MPLSLASQPPQKTPPTNHRPAKAQQQTQTNSTIITNLDKEGILKTAPVQLSPYLAVQLSPYLAMQLSEMHLKVLTESAGGIAEILYLKDYEDWKRSLLTGKRQIVLKKDQKDNSGKAVN